MKRRTVSLWSWVDASPTMVQRHLRANRPGAFERPATVRERIVRAAIGAEIARLRERDNLSQRVLGERLGVSAPQISYLEHGRAALDLPILWDLADVFDLSAQHFVDVANAAVETQQRFTRLRTTR